MRKRKRKVPDEVRAWMPGIGRKAGKKGGKSTSKAKVEAGRRNLAAGRAKQKEDRQEGEDYAS